MPHLKPTSVCYYGKQIQRHLLPAFGECAPQGNNEGRGATVSRAGTQARDYPVPAYTAFVRHSARCCKLPWTGTTLRDFGSWYLLGKSHTRSGASLFVARSALAFVPFGFRNGVAALVRIAVLTGLRIGELLALRWKHIRFRLTTGVSRTRTVSEGAREFPEDEEQSQGCANEPAGTRGIVGAA